MADHGFSVPFKFPVEFTHGVWRPANRLFVDVVCSREPGKRHRVLVVLDEHVGSSYPWLEKEIVTYFDAYAESLELVGPPLIVPGGEVAKNDPAHCFKILDIINEVGLDRHSFVVVVGGGAVLDMVSFAAAIAHRGIRLIRMPTTVLSQADSGVAVKNSLNLFGKKNFIGTFVPPFAVLNDLDFLKSLELRDRIAGIAEVVKVSLLRDPSLFDHVEARAAAVRRGDTEAMAEMIQRSAELHLAHICGNGDPFELGSARPLDFGHWAAHKLEAMSDHEVRHGEAVAVGMALDLTYATFMGYLDRSSHRRICHLLENLGFQLWNDLLTERANNGRLALLEGLREFREHLGGELHVTMIRHIGSSFEVTEMDEVVVATAIEALAAHAALPTGAASAARPAAQ